MSSWSSTSVGAKGDEIKRDINALTCVIRQLEHNVLDSYALPYMPGCNSNEVEAKSTSFKVK